MPEIKKISVNEEEQELTVADLGIWEDADDKPSIDDDEPEFDDDGLDDEDDFDDSDILPDDDEGLTEAFSRAGADFDDFVDED